MKSRLVAVIWLLLMAGGCATLDVTAKKNLEPVTEKQPVTLGIQANGDRILELVKEPGNPLVSAASEKLFAKVLLLPKEAKLLEPKNIQAKFAVDYVLTIGIGDINVSGDLNPYWFASLPLLVFKVYAPIVTFHPEVTLDMTLRDANSGTVLLQKQVIETSTDHYSPKDPGEKIRKLSAVAINNAVVAIMRTSQQSIAAARKAGQ